MIQWFSKLNASIKIAILTYLVSILGFVIFLFMFFTNMMDVPLGILFAGGVIGSINLVTGLIEEATKNKDGAIASVAFIGVRMILILGVMVLIALMYYRWNMPYFNLISYVVVYSLSIAFTVFVYLKERR